MRPEHLDFMDSDMRALWDRMDPQDLEGYRLHGGTALALYLNHRKSTDFDFFRADGGPVWRRHIEQWPWLLGAQFRGQRGMVDAVIPGTERSVTFNFISIDDFNGIDPHHPPVRADNGVAVGHPVDILTGKLAAMSNRRTVRDYWDIASANLAIPEALLDAAALYLEDEMTTESTRTDLAKSVLAFPFEVEHELPTDLIQSLAHFARSLEGAGNAPKPPTSARSKKSSSRGPQHP